MKNENIHIRHAENNPHGEKCLKNVSVDGFCAQTNTVYEFLGCYHHGHCKHFDPKKWNETKQRVIAIQKLGYTVNQL